MPAQIMPRWREALTRFYRYCDERTDPLREWMDVELGFAVLGHQVSRWNLISFVVTLVFSIWFGWYAGSWRVTLICIGGYVLGALWTIMRESAIR